MNFRSYSNTMLIGIITLLGIAFFQGRLIEVIMMMLSDPIQCIIVIAFIAILLNKLFN